MKISSRSFQNDGPIPDEFAFAKRDPEQHATLSANRNPDLAWDGVPDGCRSLALICVDPDAPTVADDVNKEGRVVPADLARADFYHWVMIDLPPTCAGIAAGECSDGVTAGGKPSPPNPAGAPAARQGVTDYTSWFAGDPDMGGTYRGYDGPAPPWNDQRVHRYHFQVYALDIDRVPIEGEFTATDVRKAIAGHVLDEATIMGRYTLNPDLDSNG
jgi:Raf kinase inhibitor-like YbhB/YbcL family protein